MNFTTQDSLHHNLNNQTPTPRSSSSGYSSYATPHHQPHLLHTLSQLPQMLARSSIARGLPQCAAKVTPSTQRGMAAAAANPFHYSVGNASDIKVASRDDGRPTTSLAVVIRGGSRYQTAPGMAHGLANFAFKVGRSPGARV